MNPFRHPSNDVELKPAKGDEDNVTSLHATRVRLTNGENPPELIGQMIVSYWQPTAEELVLLGQGRPVRLQVIGRTTPPVWVGVEGDGQLPTVDRPQEKAKLDNFDLREDTTSVDVREHPLGRLAEEMLDLAKVKNPAAGVLVLLQDNLMGVNVAMDNLDTPEMARTMMLTALDAHVAAEMGEGQHIVSGPGRGH